MSVPHNPSRKNKLPDDRLPMKWEAGASGGIFYLPL